MKPEQQRVQNVLMDTITLLCKNSLQYTQNLCIQGVIGITTDGSDVFLVHINETIGNASCSSAVQHVQEEAYQERDSLEHVSNVVSSPFKTPSKRPSKSAAASSPSNQFAGQQSRVKLEKNDANFSSGRAASAPFNENAGTYGLPMLHGIRATKTMYGPEGSTAISSTVVTESYVMGSGDVMQTNDLYPVIGKEEAYDEQEQYKTESDQAMWDDGFNGQQYANANYSSQKSAASTKAKQPARGRGSRGGVRGAGTGRGRGGKAAQSPGGQSNLAGGMPGGQSSRGGGTPSSQSSRGGGDNPYIITESSHLCGYPECGKRFKLKHDLLRHQTKVHGREPAKRNTPKKAARSQAMNEDYGGMMDQEYYGEGDEYGDEALY